MDKIIKTTVYDCSLIELSKHHHEKGNITVVENNFTVPFGIQRTYYLYDIPGGESRGGHAHRELHQLIIAASGSFSVTLDDGNVKRTFMLNRPYQGLLIVQEYGELLMIFLLVRFVWFWLQRNMMNLIILEIIKNL